MNTNKVIILLIALIWCKLVFSQEKVDTIGKYDIWNLPEMQVYPGQYEANWESLAKFINADNDSVYSKEIAYEHEGWWNDLGKHLKSTSGWNLNGTDDYAFGAISSRFRTHSGKYVRIDSHGYWWSATDYYNSAWSRELLGDDSKFYRIRYDKTEGFCVRCLQRLI